MGLSCECDGDYEPGTIVCYAPSDYQPMHARRRQRCLSCKELIDVGATAAKIPTYKVPEYDIEVQIYGECGEIPRADRWYCERCADLFFSLDELGFCVNPHDDMRQLVKDYAEFYGPAKEVPNG